MKPLELYARLGFDLEFDIALEHRLDALAVCLRDGVHLKVSKGLRVTFRHQVVLAYYLLDRRREAREHATALVAETDDFLNGAWRESYTEARWVNDPAHPEGGEKRPFVPGREGCRREFRWMEEFRDGLLWSLYLNEPTSASRLAGYAGDDLPVEFGPAHKAWRILLAYLVLGRPRQDRLAYEQVIERSRAKNPRLLLEALRAASAGDAGGFRKALSECVRHHVRTQFGERGFDNKLALDASLILHVARNAGLSVDVDQKDRDHLVDMAAAESDR